MLFVIRLWTLFRQAMGETASVLSRVTRYDLTGPPEICGLGKGEYEECARLLAQTSSVNQYPTIVVLTARLSCDYATAWRGGSWVWAPCPMLILLVSKLRMVYDSYGKADHSLLAIG